MSSESYLPYHRKYRSKTFAEYIGNAKMKKSLMASLKVEHKPQVMLYQGSAGCGKTTMARLTAKEYTCENRDDIGGACGECHNCREMDIFIETGSSDMLMNVREVDVTDSNKKQDIDDLLEDASIPAFDGSWKIYILDECHMMTNSAQNRLLKNLEEPAEKVLMILCTTDPQKLLETIISRCQLKFEVKKPTRDELGNHLAVICKKESVPFEKRALSLICVKGDFTPRKVLVLLEQVVREKQEVTYDNTVDVLNIVADRYFFDFYTTLLSDPIDIFQYISFIGEVKKTMDMKQFIDGLLTFTLRGIYITNGYAVEALDKSEKDQYKRLFGNFAVGDVAYLLDLLLNMKTTPDIEARLLLMGYTGLKRQTVQVQQDSIQLVDATEFTPAQEKRHGDESFQESIKMSPTEKKDFIDEFHQPVSADTIAQMFQGTKITLGNK